MATALDRNLSHTGTRSRVAARRPIVDGGSDRAVRSVLVFIASVMGVLIVLALYGIVMGPGPQPVATPGDSPAVAQAPRSPVQSSPTPVTPPAAQPPRPAGAPAEPLAAAPPAEPAAPPPAETARAPAPAEATPPASMATPVPAQAAAPAPAPGPQAATQAAAPAFDRAAVREVQRNLARLGFDPGLIDGTLGRGTRRAIRAYQGARGLDPNGELTPALATRLAQE
jgi:hypothetical protein